MLIIAKKKRQGNNPDPCDKGISASPAQLSNPRMQPKAPREEQSPNFGDSCRISGWASPHKAVSELEGLFKVLGVSCPLVAASIAYYPPALACMSWDGELTASCDVSLH